MQRENLGRAKVLESKLKRLEAMSSRLKERIENEGIISISFPIVKAGETRYFTDIGKKEDEGMFEGAIECLLDSLQVLADHNIDLIKEEFKTL